MKKPSRRLTCLSVTPLESRQLLSATTSPSGTWIGQDGHDFVGLSTALGADGVQDVHIAIAGLPAGRTVTLADVQGLGGGRWDSTGQPGWRADLIRAAGSTSADLYIGPNQVETGRPFDIRLTYDDGSTAEFWVTGGAADPNLRMPDAKVQALWVGQDGHDLAGPGPAVGPDGIQDVHLALSHLSKGVAVSSVIVDGANSESWQSGLNHEADANAELVTNPGDPTQADLYLNPDRDLNGQALTITVVYADGKTDSTVLTGGHSDPNLHMPAPAPVPLTWNTITPLWKGQDGLNLIGAGDVHVALSGLPAGRSIVAATLTDGQAGTWVYRGPGQSSYYADPFAGPLAVRPQAGDPTKADLDFPPVRDESGTTMTLKVLLDDGTTLVTTFAGGATNLGLRSADIAPTSVVASPGDDLNALANQFGTVHLTTGTYNLSAPLILNNSVQIIADPGATLVFSQSANDAPWTAAIKIERGHTTLQGFAVRFATPIRWNQTVNYGPAVIGTTDNLDTGPALGDPRAAITISHLNIVTPPPSSSTLEQAPDILRLVTASSGQVIDNVLRGGTTEFFGGPWQVAGNDYQGTVPGTFAFDAFAGHNTHDLVLSGNVADPFGPSGKTWRFLVLTQSGSNDLIESNTVSGIGQRDNDTIASMNAPEIILTEAYQLHFEGAPSALSADGRVVQIPQPQGGPAQTGDVVSILSGPNAGQWRRVVQAISPTAYLLDQPLPQGSYAISIATGFVNNTFENNTIDARGSSVAVDLDVAGNNYGTQVIGNLLMGGGDGLRIDAAPSESPVFWGWSHAPVLGAVIANNALIDTADGAVFLVDHGSAVKSNQGRLYMDVGLTNNTIIWTDAFLAQHPSASLTALTFGDVGSLNPGELVVTSSGNQVRGPGGMQPGTPQVVNSATINGQQEFDKKLALPSAPPAAPTQLRLIDTDGIAPADGVTSTGRVTFSPVVGAASYEYRLGTSSTYQSIGTQTTFVPTGLVAGANALAVRAVDAQGQRGSDATMTIIFIPAPPTAGFWLGQDGHDLVGPSPVAAPDGIQDIHIAVAGLPASRTITSIVVKGLGSGDWEYNGPTGTWKAALVRTPGFTTAGIFIQPYQVETGRPFNIRMTFDDGSIAGFWIKGGSADPTLHMPASLVLPPASSSPQTQAAPPPSAAASTRGGGVIAQSSTVTAAASLFTPAPLPVPVQGHRSARQVVGLAWQRHALIRLSVRQQRLESAALSNMVHAKKPPTATHKALVTAREQRIGAHSLSHPRKTV